MTEVQENNMMRKAAVTYIIQSLTIIAVMTVLALLSAGVWGSLSMIGVPLAVAAGFQVFASLTYGLAWRAVASGSSASLPTFYLAASGLRMIAGIATVLIYLFLADDEMQIRFFVFLFLAYYLVLLIYDTLYFVRVEKKIHRNA